jgi:hypothetical protein
VGVPLGYDLFFFFSNTCVMDFGFVIFSRLIFSGFVICGFVIFFLCSSVCGCGVVLMVGFWSGVDGGFLGGWWWL